MTQPDKHPTQGPTSETNRHQSASVFASIAAPKPDDVWGHNLVAERIHAIPKLVGACLDQPIPQLSLPTDHEITITGIGSSRGIAEYLATLLSSGSKYSARFQEVTTAADRQTSWGPTIVFSQGLSANMGAVFDKIIQDRQGIVVTSVTEEGAQRKGNQRALKILSDCRDAGVSVVQAPMENEYQVLVRSIGPWFGFLTAYRIAQALEPERFPPIRQDALESMFSRAAATAHEISQGLPREVLQRGTHIVTCSNPTLLRNVGEKFVEGIFVPRPMFSNLLEFNHGPYQLLARTGGHAFLVEGESPADKKLVHELADAIRSLPGGKASVSQISSELPSDIKILEYEMIFNFVMLNLMRQGGSECDQIRFQEGVHYDKVVTL
jgi:hypothetical protein